MKWLLPALLASLALALPAAAQPAPPPPQAQTPINTYCWNGTAVVMCGGGLAGTRTQPKVTSAIAIGNTFQKALDLDTSRKSCMIANDNQHIMYVFLVGVGETGVTTPGTGTATLTNSIKIPPSGSFECQGVQDEIDVTTSTAGDTFTPVFAR